MTTEKAESGNRITGLVKQCFGEMPTRTTVLARLYLLGALTVLCAAILLLTAAYTWMVLWAVQ